MNAARRRLVAKARLRTPHRRALAAAALVLLAGCARSPERPLRVGISTFPGYSSLHLARSLGYFDTSQVRLVELANARQVSDHLRDGTVDAATLTLDEAFVVKQDRERLRVVLVMDMSRGADAVMARPDIATLRGLRGKRIGVETSSVGAVMLDAMLSSAGLVASDLRIVDLSANEHVAAYRAGEVDAVVTFEPMRSQLLELGARALFDSRSIPERIVDVLVVRADATPTHRRALAALVAAHFRAREYLEQNPADAAARLAPFLDVASDQVLLQFAGLHLPDLAENHLLLSGATPHLVPTASELLALMLQHRLLRSAVSPDSLVDAGFLPALAR